MSLCTTLCVRVCICECICQSWMWLHVKLCVCKSVHVWVCVWMIVHASVCVFVYVCISKWADICRSMCVCVCVCVWVHIYTHVLRRAGALHAAVWLWPCFMSPPQILLLLNSWCPNVSENYSTSLIQTNLSWARVNGLKTQNYWIFRKIGNHYSTE